MAIDKKKFLAAFGMEAQGLITQLNSGLVKLEDESADAELLDGICRAAHTLKGSSRMMGFGQICEVAHRMEDILFKVRDGEMVFHSGVADSIFAALDVVTAAIERVVHGEAEGVDVEGVCGRIAEAGEGPAKEAQATPVKKRVVKKKITAKKKPVDKKVVKKKQAKKKVASTGDHGRAEKSERIEVESVKEGVTPSPRMEPAPIETSIEADKPRATEDEYIRVPISRVNRLLNLIGEMVISKVKSAYRVSQIKTLTKKTRDVEKLLYDTKRLVKEALDVPDELIHSNGKMLRASREFEKATYLLDHLHEIEVGYDGFRSEMTDLFEDIQGEVFQLSPVIEELQQKMKEIRMLPCATIFEVYPRLVRDIARERDKPVHFVIEGADTELDKKVLEAINGPLIHILRNAVDHGLEVGQARLDEGKNETGTITLSAVQEGGKVVITVADDGAGIDLEEVKAKALSNGIIGEDDAREMADREVLNLVFAKGFSTSNFITDISGRGVGLDVVRNEIERLKGAVEITTEKGKGTAIRLELPLTIAVMRALLVKAGGVRWAFQMSSMERSLSVAAKDIASIENRMVIQVQGKSVPVVPLVDLLGVVDSPKEDVRGKGQNKQEEFTVLIASSLDREVGFIVDSIEGEDEVFIKNIGMHLGKVDGVNGATVLASGEVVVILDAQDLMRRANLAHPAAVPVKRMVTQETKKRILVVEDSLTTRELEKAILESSGFEVETAIDGLDAMEKLSKGSFDAIITDINMPRMDGFELCRNIRTNDIHNDVPIIFVTALSRDEEKRRGIDLGAQAYITKGQFDQTNLLETLERLL
jgi:two-component system, chemotaxis family, sensor kinase CheA